MLPPRVTLVQDCELTVSGGDWPFAKSHAKAIEAHWQRRTAENPAYFNGRIFMLAEFSIRRDVFCGRLMPVEFKAFLYWKESGAPDASAFDVFGSALLRSSDGAILLGRQRRGHLNAGLVYLPGGFIDPRDAGADGRVDIRASVLREVQEETGLAAGSLAVSDGLLVTTVGRQVSIAVELRGEGSAAELQSRIRCSLAQEETELDDIVAVRTRADLERLQMPEYAQVLLRHLLRR